MEGRHQLLHPSLLWGQLRSGGSLLGIGTNFSLAAQSSEDIEMSFSELSQGFTGLGLKGPV